MIFNELYLFPDRVAQQCLEQPELWADVFDALASQSVRPASLFRIRRLLAVAPTDRLLRYFSNLHPNIARDLQSFLTRYDLRWEQSYPNLAMVLPRAQADAYRNWKPQRNW